VPGRGSRIGPHPLLFRRSTSPRPRRSATPGHLGPALSIRTSRSAAVPGRASCGEVRDHRAAAASLPAYLSEILVSYLESRSSRSPFPTIHECKFRSSTILAQAAHRGQRARCSARPTASGPRVGAVCSQITSTQLIASLPGRTSDPFPWSRPLRPTARVFLSPSVSSKSKNDCSLCRA
jgi:hypothetical protein